jgi:methylenetetrahydrofolate dehydrogenase (NADP+)/methenyltetrahydrofolate cyclohydrolase
MPITFSSVGPWYSTEEAAEIMGRTPGHVSRQCKKGEFDCKKAGNNYLLHEDVVKRLRYKTFNPDELAHIYRREQQISVERKGYKKKLNILGILAQDAGDAASMIYARTLKKACDFIGFELGLVESNLRDVMKRIQQANDDPSIHGIFVFYPIFKDYRDRRIKDKIIPFKDIEGLSNFWSDKLYSNKRYLDNDKRKKAILPCTSLGILKMLAYVDSLDEQAGQTFAGKKITIFNRSDVVGRPLAYMLKNDGATVYSFDIEGGVVMRKNGKEKKISREKALRESDAIITGVPSRAFEKIRGEEIKENATCLNFSFVQNFEESAKERAGIFIPRVGPMTIAMCLRNVVRLYENNRDVYVHGDNVHPFEWQKYGTVVQVAA